MSPTKKPSAVTGLRRAVSGPQAEAEAAAFIEGATPGQKTVRGLLKTEPSPKARKPKPIRITVDLPPEEYETLGRLVGSIPVGPPRLSINRAVRAMIRATAADPIVREVVTDLLCRE